MNSSSSSRYPVVPSAAHTTYIPMGTTYTPSTAVQERMREMREKEARLKQDKLEEIQRIVASASIDWEAEVLFELEKNPRLGYTTVPTPRRIEICLYSYPEKYHRYMLDCFNQLLKERPDYSKIVLAIQNGKGAKNLPQAFTVVNERARIRLRVLMRVLRGPEKERRYCKWDEFTKTYYKWDVVTGKHLKWVEGTPPEPHLAHIHSPSHPVGHWVSWNPRDPTGAIAAKMKFS